MSEVATLNAKDRKTALASIAEKIRGGAERIRLATLEVGTLMREAGQFFSADQADDYWNWCQNVTGWSVSNCRNVVNAAAVVETLTPKQREKIAGWQVAAIEPLHSVKDQKQRTAILAKVKATSPDPKRVREVRAEVTGRETSTRNRKTDADKTIALAAEIRPTVLKALKSKRTAVALVAGANLAQDHRGKDIAAAILHLIQNDPEVKTAATAK